MSEKYYNIIYNLLKTFGMIINDYKFSELTHGNIKIIIYSMQGFDIVIDNCCYFIVFCGKPRMEQSFVPSPEGSKSIPIDEFDDNNISMSEVKNLVDLLERKNYINNFIEYINKCIIDMI